MAYTVAGASWCIPKADVRGLVGGEAVSDVGGSGEAVSGEQGSRRRRRRNQNINPPNNAKPITPPMTGPAIHAREGGESVW